MAERLVVIGGDAAGMSAASQARRRRGAADLDIVAFERGPFTSYSACGIPYWLGGLVEDRAALVARPPEVFRERFDIDVRTRHEVTAIDLDARAVTVRALDAGRESVEPFDQLMVATGAVPVRPPVAGIDASGVVGVQTLEDGQHVLDVITERDPRRIVVIGAGYIGVEMAEAMCRRGLEVHVVARSTSPMATMDPDLGDRIADGMLAAGIRLHLGAEVDGIEVGDDGWVRAVVADDQRFDADLVVLGTGTRPASDLAAAAGIPVGDESGLVVDERQRTPIDGVWAAGDCVESFHRVSRRPVAIALGTVANRQGRVAGINLGGGEATFPGVLGTAVTQVCGVEIARTGLGEPEAAEAGLDAVAATVTSTTRAGYYPGAGELDLKVVAERGSGRLLGAQIVGSEGTAKRIDVLATAIWNGMDAAGVAELDLSYAPPFSPVWDPVLIAARKAAAAARGA